MRGGVRDRGRDTYMPQAHISRRFRKIEKQIPTVPVESMVWCVVVSEILDGVDDGLEGDIEGPPDFPLLFAVGRYDGDGDECSGAISGGHGLLFLSC